MSMEGDLCLSLFERLKSIQHSQEVNHSYIELLQKLKDMENDDKELQDYKQNDMSMKKESSFNSEHEETNNSRNSININMCHPNADISQKTNGELSHGFCSLDNLQTDTQENATPHKFAYLKKRQGLARFNYKICKGFKKKNADSNQPAKAKTKTPIEIGVIKSDIHKKLQTEKRSNFEKLEEMVGNDSFCSTSSAVLDLLQESVSSHLSPISSRVSGKESSTIRENNFNYSYCSSPVKSFSSKARMTQFSNKELTSSEEIKNSKTFVSNKRFSSSEKCILGILKKSGGNSSTPLCSPKVKFLEQEVKVLEYEKDENLTNSSIDTDLVSLSDLENLPLIHTVSNFPVEDTLSFKLCEDSPIISDANLRTSRMFCKDKSEIENKEASIEKVCNDESLEVKSYKMLMLAKVNDLVREIEIFKEKNKYLEELISKEENKKFLNKETSLVTPKACILKSKLTPKACILKSKLKDHSHSVPNKISLQLQKLNEKLQSLERENNLLKKKVQQLEKRNMVMRDRHENTIKHCEISYSSQNKISRVAVKNKVQKSMDSIHLNEKQSICTASKTPIVEDKIDSSIPERFSLLCDVQDTISMPSNAIVGNKGYGFKASEDINNPLVPSGFDLKFSVREGMKVTHQRNISRDFIAKEGKNITSILDNDAKDSLVVDEKKNYNVNSSNDTTELLNNAPTENLNENRMFKQGVVKKDVRIFDNYRVSSIEKSSLRTTERELNKYVTYPNGDKEIIYSNKKVYHYAVNNSTRTTFFDDGKEEIKFSNGQREIYYSNGTFEITFPDLSSKTVYGDGSENFTYQDGTEVHINKDNTKVIHFANGQKEIYKSDSTSRVFPDGTIKILYKDGSEETRYLSGKIRFKSSNLECK